jgi:tRNA nucleotidyltransferase (CCA-adding enzyme)
MKEYIPILIKKINEEFFRAKVEGYKALKLNCKDIDIYPLFSIADNLDSDVYYTIHDLYQIILGNYNFGVLSKIMLDINSKLKSSEIHFKYISDLYDKSIVKVLQHSKNSCLVGGGVRDTLLGEIPKDFDFVTDIPYDNLETLFIKEGFTVKEAGKQFLVMIVSKDGKDYEIANFRKDGTYVDGRRPESVEIGTIYDDAERRDFTVNALYFNISSMKLIDPTGKGIDDIYSNTLRFVGNPKDRIEQDYLRAFRFYRFVNRGFTPDNKSLSAVRNYFDDACKNTSSERIRAEIEKMIPKGLL